jgi:hypothetical protein
VVIKLSDNTYLILGDDWLKKYKAHVDYVSITCVIQKGKQNILLQTNPWMHWAPKSLTKGLSAMQFKKARKGGMPILFQLTKVDDRETSSQLIDIGCLAALLENLKMFMNFCQVSYPVRTKWLIPFFWRKVINRFLR